MKARSRRGFLSATATALGMLTLISLAELGHSHHSFPATYVEGETARIEGELVAFMFRNPHSFVHVNVKDETGNVIRYAVEWGAAAALGRQGIDRGTLRPGDYVVITGLAGRNASDHRVLLRTIERPADGFRWGFEEGETFE